MFNGGQSIDLANTPRFELTTANYYLIYIAEAHQTGIGLHTPHSVHDGTARQIRERRQQVLDAAYAARPDRFRGRRPLAPALPGKAWINKPRPTIQSQKTTGINQAA